MSWSIDPDGPDPSTESLWWELEDADPEPPYVPGWLRSPRVRVVVAIVVAIALAAFTIGWAFIGLRPAEDPPPRPLVEVLGPTAAA
jgi:hypothetical protein